MANEENLRKGNPDTQFRSGREAVENGKKGGIKSGEARRGKKLLRECMERLLQMPVSDKKEYKKIENIGIPSEEIDNRYRITVALFLKAASGDVTAYREIRDITGENERDSEMEKIDEMLNEVDRLAAE